MSIDTEIETLQAQLDQLLVDSHRLSHLKGQAMQTLMDLADSRVLLEALHNSCASVRDSQAEGLKERSILADLKERFQILNEDIYKRKDDAKSSKNEQDSLENQLRIIENNQEALQMSLTKLKTKSETHRESELLQLKRRIADEDSRYKELLRRALTDANVLEEQRLSAQATVNCMIEDSRSELHELQSAMNTPQALSASVGSATPVVRRRVIRPAVSGSPFATSYGPTPTRGGLFADSAASVGFGWQSGESSTPVQINISNFLLSEKKQRDDDDSRIELDALYAELEEEIFKLANDDWMYPHTTYSN